MGMMRSLLGIFFILCSVPLLAAGLGSADSYVGFTSKTYDIAAGCGLFILGFVLGKYWVINYHKKKS
jgi:hypothetical protein